MDADRSKEEFSWERWLGQGLSALRRTLFRYDFGLPEEFWHHLERAAHELLSATRILLRTLRQRGQRSSAAEEPRGGPIDIEWD